MLKEANTKKNGDKATNKEKEEAIEKLRGCFGRPSTTKAERDAAKKKKEYLDHSSLLRTFGLNATSTYDSYLPLIFGKFVLI